MKNYFELSRFWLLLKMELFRSRKGILMTIVIAFGVMCTGQVLEIIFEDKKVFDTHAESHSFALIVGGFILSSLAFSDLTNSLKRQHYLTLPASTLEKFLSMWLLTSVGWIVLLTIVYTVYAFVANLIAPVFFSHVTFGAFAPLGEAPLETMKYYFVFQGIFLVGAAHFQGYVFPKTIFTLILFAALCGTIAYFMMAETFMTDHECSSASECELLKRIEAHGICHFITLFWWVLAPLCWVITYVGLKEQEA
jgi:hypothetical protein